MRRYCLSLGVVVLELATDQKTPENNNDFARGDLNRNLVGCGCFGSLLQIESAMPLLDLCEAKGTMIRL